MSNYSSQRIQVTIVGNGAIGNVLATRCWQLQLNYGVITRNNQKIDLQVTDGEQAAYFIRLPIVPLAAITQSELVLLPIKAYQVSAFIEQALPYISEHQTIVLLHNGMGTIEYIQTRLPTVNIVAATTTYGAFKPSANKLEIKGKGATDLGWVQHSHGDKSAIEKLLSHLLPPATWYPDVRLPLWNKLAINAVINPLTALYNVQNGELAVPYYQQQIIRLCNEITLVMQHLGLAVESQKLLSRVNQVIAQTSANYSSMNRDVKAKRQTEIDFINGYIVEQAAQLGLSSVENSHLLHAIKGMEKQY